MNYYLKSINGTPTVLVSETEMPNKYKVIEREGIDNTWNETIENPKYTKWFSSCKQYPCADKENETLFAKLAHDIHKNSESFSSSYTLDLIKIPNERVKIMMNNTGWCAYYIPIVEDVKEETDWEKIESEFIDILYEGNGTGSGATSLVDWLKQNYNVTRIKT